MASQTSLDVVIVGGGHNGPVAAGYLARAGLRVRVLGGSTSSVVRPVSAQAFRRRRRTIVPLCLPGESVAGADLADLGAEVGLARRRYASYTPNPADGGAPDC